MIKKIIAILFLIVVSAALYTTTLRGIYGNNDDQIIAKEFDVSTKPFELSPERGRYAHVIALVKTGKYTLDEKLMRFVYPDVGYYGGGYYSFFAPGISYLAVPLYKLGFQYDLSQVFVFGLSSIASVLALVFLFLIARDILKLPTWASIIAPLVFAFSTPAWSYAITLYQHHLTTLFIVSGFYFAWKFKQDTKLGFLWALLVGINYGLALSIDYPNALLFLPVGIYLFISSFSIIKNTESFKIKFRPVFLLSIIGFFIVTGLHFKHNQHYYGSTLRLSGSLIGVKDLEQQGVVGKSDAEIQEKLSGVAKSKANIVNFFSEENMPWGFSVLTGSTDRGLLFYSPIMILSVFGIIIFATRKRFAVEVVTLLGLIGVNIFLYSSWGDPWGGWAFGPRYLIPSTSILSLFIAGFLSQGKWLLIKRIIALPLLAYSTAIALLGALTTNAVPPKVEGVFLHSKWNYLFNWQFFKDGKTGSFLYNTYFFDLIRLQDYAYLIYGFVMLVFLILLFVLPLFGRKKEEESK